jgi:hypothetical protein
MCRISTVQSYGPDGYREALVLHVVYKQPLLFMKEIYEVLFEAAEEWTDVNQELYIVALRGDPKNPVSWRPLEDHDHIQVKYDPTVRTFIRNGKTLKVLEPA